MKRQRPASSAIDPALPLTWPVRWHIFQAWGRTEGDIADPFIWNVTRPFPNFDDDDLLAAYRAGTVRPAETIASGGRRSIDDARAAVEAALHALNLELEAHYLTPRISIDGYTTGTTASFFGSYTPTTGGRP